MDGEKKPGYPVKNLADGVVGIYQRIGKATRPSKVLGGEAWRSPMNRAARSEMLCRRHGSHRFDKTLDFETRGAWDEFDRQFENQTELEINMGELGTQKTHMVDIVIPEMQKKHHRENMPPIVFLPAYAGDHFGVESLIREAALKGFRVVAFDWPESTLGKTTEEFAQAVEKSEPYEVHADFAETTIKQTIGDKKPYLVGYSGGGAVVLREKGEFEGIVAIAPPSLVDRGVLKNRNAWLGVGAMVEGDSMVADGLLGGLAGSGIVLDEPRDPDNAKRRKRISDAWFKWIPRKSPILERTNIRTGGKVLVVSGDKDYLTLSKDFRPDLKFDFQLDTLLLPDFSHEGLLIKAGEVWNEIEKKMGWQRD